MFRMCLRSFSGINYSKAMAEPYYYNKTGDKLTKESFLQELERFRGHVFLVGENHSDPSGHKIELDILKRLHNSFKERKLALSLEFWDRECQGVLDEYLAGFHSKDTFLSDSRPPGNHEDYEPLLDYCKEKNLPVIAANCPRRFTRMVSKNGRNSLADCVSKVPSSAHLLPPLPYNQPSSAYRDKFIDIMRLMGNENPNVPTSMLDAQSLWDATMAHTIASKLEEYDQILHITGHFHVEKNLGIQEHLKVYKSDITCLSVVILPEEDPSVFHHQGAADYIVLTDLNQI